MQRALIVDDDAQVLSLTARWLQRAGYDAVVSTDFLDARVQLQVCQPSAVITDVRLGLFNGIQLGLLARELFPDVRVAIISGWNDPVMRREAAQLGAVFLHKPFRAIELLSAIGLPQPPAS